MLETHAFSYNSENSSVTSSKLDSSRSNEPDFPNQQNIFIGNNEESLHERSLSNLSGIVRDEDLIASITKNDKNHNDAMLIQDNLSDENPSSRIPDHSTNVIPDLLPQDFAAELDNIQCTPIQEDVTYVTGEVNPYANCLSFSEEDMLIAKSEHITALIWNSILEESLTFPKRFPLHSRHIGKDASGRSKVIQALAYDPYKGILLDAKSMGEYVDELFGLMLKERKEVFIEEVNKPIERVVVKVLEELRGGKVWPKLPHEVQPIIPQCVYANLEEKRTKTTRIEYLEFEKIYNKAIFDAVNEALNLIRPYGLVGDPLPWSWQQRVLFKSITDPFIITRNIRNMVLDWATFEVGTLPKSEFLANGRFAEEFFSEVRERRLINMLAQEVALRNFIGHRYCGDDGELCGRGDRSDGGDRRFDFGATHYRSSKRNCC
eukprot:TRINITY_DN13259_c0_g1_i1.p1 TRINITY_DN13259_c0_g1~~TRINITY_DN13259_c0_g1_i1.p1  ORF type:complete len:433 (-),score=73.61 TRINITY_DN13259_c0_g1_i1:75-1373(-)